MKRAAWLALALGLAVAFWSAAQESSGYKVVVHADNPSPGLSKSQVSKMFLGTIRSWDHRQPVLPVDQMDSSPVRETFSRAVHQRSVDRIKSYWNRKIFSGEGTPPPEVSSDQQTLAFVRANPGAIGYVSAGARLGSGVRVLPVGD